MQLKKLTNLKLDMCPDGHKHLYKEHKKTLDEITFKCSRCGNEFSIPNFDTIMDNLNDLLK